MQKRYEREIINNFPYPIASRFTRLRTRQCKKPSLERLSHLFATAEIISRYLALIVISECREHMESQPKSARECPHFINCFFAKDIKRPSWGCWVGFLREGLKWLHQQQVDLIMPELHHFWFTTHLKPTKAAIALDKLVDIRNKKTGHNLSGLHEYEYPALCEEIWEKLTIILEALDFLPDYELRFIHKIEVRNVRRQTTAFIHEYSSGIGSTDDFEADDESQSTFMESDATLLLNPKNHRYLNLEPLMVYENAAGKAPDVFFYEGMRCPENAHYVACKHGGTFILNGKNNIQDTQRRERRERMIEELHHIISLFSPQSTNKEQLMKEVL